MRRQLVALALVAVSTQLVLGYGSGTLDATHLKLTSVLFDASAPKNLVPLVLTPRDYPDLSKFSQAVIDGANSEAGHEDPSDPGTRYWYGSEGLWENVVLASQYPAGNFFDAYTSIGHVVHLTQDATIPAHDRVIFHGYPGLYYIAPGGQLLDDTKYQTAQSDNLEFTAGDHDLSTLPVVDVSLAAFHASPGAWSNTPQPYNSTSDSCQNVTRKLWLCDGEAASPDRRDDYAGVCRAPLSRSWGTYSFPAAPGCAYPPVGGDLDWYPRQLSPTDDVEAPQTAHEIGRAALYLAIRESSEALKRFSRSLPPVVTPPASRIVTDVARGRATTFTVHVQDNRTPGVYLTVRDAATQRTIRARIAAPGLPGTTIDLDGSLRIPLGGRPDQDLTTLPWADAISITWDGALSDGPDRIGSGDQSLVVEARDEDGNVARGVVLVKSGAAPDSVSRNRAGKSPGKKSR